MSLTAAFEGSTGLNEAHRREIEGRVGTAGGRAVRSFHINFGSVKASAPAARGWSQAIDYAARQGKYAKDGEDREEGPDVLHVAGSPDALREACKTIDAGVRQRRGKTAERILVKETVELPSDVEDEPAAWKAGAEAIVADWRKRGHEAVAAVHLHGEERDHPHLHVLVAARPVNADGGVDRSRRLLVGKAAVKDERANAAERINEACEPKIRFHPGKLKEIGIERAAKKRIPQGEFRARRAEIRAAPEKAAAIEQAMYAESAAMRRPLHEERQARYAVRKSEIDALKAVDNWPPKSQRGRLQERAAESGAEAERWQAAWRKVIDGIYKHAEAEPPDLTTPPGREEAHRFALTSIGSAASPEGGWAKAAHALIRAAHEHAGLAEPELDTLAGAKAAYGAAMDGAGRAEERAALEKSEGRVADLEAAAPPLRVRQRTMLADVCARNGIEGPLGDPGVQLLAWHAYHWEQEEREKRKQKEARHDGRGIEAARAVDGGAVDAGGGADDGGRRGPEDGGGASPGGEAGQHRGEAGRHRDPASPSTAGAPVVEPGAVVAGASPEVVDEKSHHLDRPGGLVQPEDAGGDNDSRSDSRSAVDRLRSLGKAVPGPADGRGRPVVGGDPADVVASRSAATADAGLARSVTPPDPGGGIGAGQLTCEQFLKRARDRGEARDATDIRFEDVVPSIRLRYAPGNALDWRNKQDEPPPWLYERGGEVVMGFAGGEKDWAKIAGYVHAVEVEHAIAQSREEKGPPVPPHVLNQYGVDTAGRRARRGSGQGGGGGKSDRDDGPDFSGPSRLALALAEIARARQQQNTL